MTPKEQANAVMIIIWILIGLSFVFFFPTEDDPFGMVTIIFSLIYLLLGILLFFSLSWNLYKTKTKGSLILLSSFIITAIIFLVSIEPLERKGSEYRRENSFNQNLPIYEEIVAQAEKDKKSIENTSYKGVFYQVEATENVRVAFPLRGILDNWEAIVYDPTGEVLKAEGFTENGKFSAPDNLKKIFGGDLVFCKNIQGNYYRCWFT